MLKSSEKSMVANISNEEEACSFVAQRLKQARCIKQMPLNTMAKLLGISRKQLQNYENAQSNITVARLWQISKILDIDTSFFVEGLNSSKQLLSNDDLELVRMFGKIKDQRVKDTLWGIIKVI